MYVVKSRLNLVEQTRLDKRSGNCYSPTLGRTKEVVDGKILSGLCNQEIEGRVLNHVMMGADVDKYKTQFHEPARLVPRMVTIESKRIDCYIRVLDSAIRRTMETSPLEIECHTFLIDLIPFGYGNFDVIIGMDWLSKLKAKTVCFEKIVQIPLYKGSILEVHGEHPEGDLKQLKTMKVNEPKLEDIPIVREFLGVFLEDLPGLPPSREVEFRIDLIPGAMPTAKSPYCLAPTEMQEEISNQLKEL
ncbi:hypothetical protein Tco_0462370 [Tanacetum coccineum]